MSQCGGHNYCGHVDMIDTNNIWCSSSGTPRIARAHDRLLYCKSILHGAQRSPLDIVHFSRSPATVDSRVMVFRYFLLQVTADKVGGKLYLYRF